MSDKPFEALNWAANELRNHWRKTQSKARPHFLLDLEALGIDWRTAILRNRIEFGQKSLRQAFDDQSAMFFYIEKHGNWQRKGSFNLISIKEVQDFFQDPLGSVLPKEIPFDQKWFEDLKQFIQQEPDSLSHPVVAKELAYLRRLNTSESLVKLEELLKAYIVRDSGVKSEKRREEIERWYFKIFPAIKNEQESVAKEFTKTGLSKRKQKAQVCANIQDRFVVPEEAVSLNWPLLLEIESLTRKLRFYLQYEIATLRVSNDSLGPLLLSERFCAHPHL